MYGKEWDVKRKKESHQYHSMVSHPNIPSHAAQEKKRKACITEPMLWLIIKENDDIHLQCSFKGTLGNFFLLTGLHMQELPTTEVFQNKNSFDRDILHSQ